MRLKLIPYIIGGILLLLSSCKVAKQADEPDIYLDNYDNKAKFIYTKDYPIIKDTSLFISALQNSFKGEPEEIFCSKGEETITTFKKVKLYGSDDEYYFIEYTYPECGGMINFPYRFQFLVDKDAYPVEIFSAFSCDFIEIFPDENPFLIMTVVSSRGNGGHEIYKINSDGKAENVYEGYYDYNVRTVDFHEDADIFDPYELNLVIKDYNNDGFNDIAFTGERVLIFEFDEDGDIMPVDGDYSFENPYKRIPVEYIFLYDPETGHFKMEEKEDY